MHITFFCSFHQFFFYVVSYIEVNETSARFDHLNQYFTLEDTGSMLKMGKWELEKKQISQLKILWFHESNSKTIEWIRVVTIFFF
jgi:hypothetical protein